MQTIESPIVEETAIPAVTQQHEPIVNSDPKFHETFEPGDVTHQGDLIIVCLPEWPVHSRSQIRGSLQLADGETQGSRHVLREGTDVYDCTPSLVATMIADITEKRGFRVVVEPDYIGPVWMSPENPTENDLTHPEHGNQGWPAGTILAAVFQRTLVNRSAQRALD